MAIKLNPEDAEIHYNRGNPYFMLEEYQKAFDNYDKAIELDPEHIDAKKFREIALKKLGDQGKSH